jgi:DNA repair photolyase
VGPPESFRWRSQVADSDRDGRLFGDEEVVERHVGVGEYRGLEFLHVEARRILNEVPAGTYGFRWTVNAYRGCSHACVYCFARPTHTYLGLDMGDDFDRKIVVKVNAVERLRAELRHPRWRGELVAMGTNTDPYQRAEGRYHLTQGLLGVLSEARNPFSVLTKSPLVLRDIDLLAAAARHTLVDVNLSVGTLDDRVWQLTETGAPHPRRRLAAVARLSDAGVACGVLMGPVLPGLSDAPEQLAETVEAAVRAGAASVTAVYLHLRGPLREHVLRWAAREDPPLAERWARLYGRRANAPPSMQAELAAQVAELVEAARKRFGPPPPPLRPPSEVAVDGLAVRSNRRSAAPADPRIAGRARPDGLTPEATAPQARASPSTEPARSSQQLALWDRADT